MSNFTNFLMIPNLVKIFDNLDFVQNFRKIMISQKFNRKISILGKIFENVDFGLNFWKTSFWSKFSEFSILVKIVKKFRFWSIFLSISILVKISQNVDSGKKKILENPNFW